MTKAEYLGRFGYSLADVATLCVGDFKWHRQNSNARYKARLGKTDLFRGYSKRGIK